MSEKVLTIQGAIFDKYAVGVIKARMAQDCYRYIDIKKKGKTVLNLGERIDGLQVEIDNYFQVYWKDLYRSERDLIALIKIIKDNNLMIPFGAETWEEIDSVKK